MIDKNNVHYTLEAFHYGYKIEGDSRKKTKKKTKKKIVVACFTTFVDWEDEDGQLKDILDLQQSLLNIYAAYPHEYITVELTISRQACAYAS